MTVSTTSPRMPLYTGNGVTTAYPYTFRVFAATDIVVKVKSGGIETTKTYLTDYTVSGVGSYSGGYVTFVSVPASGDSIAISRSVPLTQTTDLQNQGPYYAQTIEDMSDRSTMEAQQIQAQLDRTLQIRETDYGIVSTALPVPSASSLLGWNSTATGITNITTLTGISVLGNPIVDAYTGGVHFTAGVTTALTLSQAPGSKNQTVVTFNGLIQHKSSYSTSGVTLTFSSAIPVGVTQIEVAQVTTLAIPLVTPVAGSITSSMLAGGSVTQASLASDVQYQVDTIAALKGLAAGAYNTVLVRGYAAAGDGGGGLFRWNGSDATADNSGTVIAPTAGAGRWNRIIQTGVIDIRQFGALGGGVIDDQAAVQAAATYLAANGGGEMVFPQGTFLIGTPVTIAGNNITMTMVSGAAITRPSGQWNNDLFIVSGNGVTMRGAPGATITSPATFDGTNIQWTYAVIRVTGNKFTADGIRLVNVPRVGFGLSNVDDCTVRGCFIEGNFPPGSFTGVETMHAGIAWDPSASANTGDCIIEGNTIKSCVQGMFTANYGAVGSEMGLIVNGNVFEAMINHGVYAISGYGQQITNNEFSRCSLPIACWGRYAVVTGNTLYTAATGDTRDLTGISIRDAKGCIIAGNTIKGDAPVGGVIISLDTVAGGSGLIEDNIICDNVIDCGTSVGSSIAIRVGSSALTTSNKNNRVCRNTIKCPGVAANGVIQFNQFSPNIGRFNAVIDNRITIVSDNYGVQMILQSFGEVKGNTINLEYSPGGAKTVVGINANTCTDMLVERNRIVCESTFGTNVTFNAYTEVTSGARLIFRQNQISLSPTLLTGSLAYSVFSFQELSGNVIGVTDAMYGTAVVATGTGSITVANKNAKTNNVMIWPLDAAAAANWASIGFFVSVVDGTSLTIQTGSGTVGSNCTFGYRCMS